MITGKVRVVRASDGSPARLYCYEISSTFEPYVTYNYVSFDRPLGEVLDRVRAEIYDRTPRTAWYQQEPPTLSGLRVGDLWFRISDQAFHTWNGTRWIESGPPSPVGRWAGEDPLTSSGDERPERTPRRRWWLLWLGKR